MGLWFAIEMGAVVIPSITVPTPASVSFALDGLENCQVVAFSTKDYVNDVRERQTLKKLFNVPLTRSTCEASWSTTSARTPLPLTTSSHTPVNLV